MATLSKFWNRLIIATTSLLLIIAFLFYMVVKGFEGVATSDDVSVLEVKLAMNGGALQLGLYSQHMWDAILWTVVASTETLSQTISSPNGVWPAGHAIVVKSSQSGFERPRLQLVRENDTLAALCEDDKCRQLKCIAISKTCTEQSN